MKIIEAMKRVKANKEKIADLQDKIKNHCANLDYESPVYGDQTRDKIREWLQSCQDLSQENVRLLCAIGRTNLQTQVTITLGDKPVTKSIAEWVWRRREYAKIDLGTFKLLSDRGLKEGTVQTSTGVPKELRIERHYDPEYRDRQVSIFQQEPHEIDACLEIINAVTDLIE